MVSIKNAYPRPIFTGIKDESGRALPVVREAIPQHCPLFYIMAKRGPLDPQLAAGKGMVDLYDAESFNQLSKYYSHQTMGVEICNGNGNLSFIKRVVAADAARASLVLYLEIVEADLPAYERDSSGEVEREIDGSKKIHATDVVDGYLLRWSLKALDDVNNLRGELKTDGDLVGKTGATSTRYPIMAFVMGYGEYGNNIGLSLSYGSPNTSFPTDASVIDVEQAMIYRGRWSERESEYHRAFTTSTLQAEEFVEFALRENVVNRKTVQKLPVRRLMTDYRDTDPNREGMPEYGPFDDMYVYQEHIEEIAELLHTKETAASIFDYPNKHQVNIMDAQDVRGFDHYAVRMADDSLSLDENSIHYALGGSDGTVDEATLDQLVSDEVQYNWENVDYPLVEHAKYPFSCVYDTGFSLPTKQAIIGCIGWRPEISVAACTQDVLEDPNTISEESSIMTALRAYARLFPESTLYGTPCCRVVLFGQVGDVLYNNYPRKAPLLMDHIHKRSKYMGAGDGKMKRQFAYDVSPANRVNTMNNVTHPWKKDNTRSVDWELGLNWAQWADRKQLFYPCVQTVYDDDTSVLNSEINMLILVDVLKQCEEVWRQMTGNVLLTKAQFIDRCNTLLTELVAGRYDERVVIVPRAHHTAADEARGFSWTMEVAVYMNNMPTVETIKVISRRRDDL